MKRSFAGLGVYLLVLSLSIVGIRSCVSNEPPHYLANRAILQRKDWPEFLQELNSQDLDTTAFATQLTVYEIYSDEYVFQCDNCDTFFELIKDRWKLERIDKNMLYVRRFQTRIPKKCLSDDNEYFANPNRREGDKGMQIVICRSPSRGTLAGHYYFNF